MKVTVEHEMRVVASNLIRKESLTSFTAPNKHTDSSSYCSY